MKIPLEIEVFWDPACKDTMGREEVGEVGWGDLLEVYGRVSLGYPSQYYTKWKG